MLEKQKIGKFLPRFLVVITLLVSLLFSTISLNFQSISAQVNSEKEERVKQCSDVAAAAIKSANDAFDAARKAIGPVTDQKRMDAHGAAAREAMAAIGRANYPIY